MDSEDCEDCEDCKEGVRHSCGMALRPYQKLKAWQEAHELCLFTYQVTSAFPAVERFGLTSQMRRAGSGVPMNIAEGNMKRSKKEHMHFLSISLASLEELHYQYVLAKDLRYISDREMEEAMHRIHRTGYLLSRLRASLRPTAS